VAVGAIQIKQAMRYYQMKLSVLKERCQGVHALHLAPRFKAQYWSERRHRMVSFTSYPSQASEKCIQDFVMQADADGLGDSSLIECGHEGF
jgi:hypothetical protein